MSTRPDASARTQSEWHKPLKIATTLAMMGMLSRFAAPLLPVPLATLLLGTGLIAAAFMLAWAADAGESVFSGGPVLAAVAVVGVLPEFTIEVHFAFVQQAELVTANLTGATRLLLSCAVALPLLVGALKSKRNVGPPDAIGMAGPRRLELGILLVAAVFGLQILVKGSATVFDGVILLLLYVLYVRRVQGTPDEEPAVIGVAAGLVSLPARWRRPAVAGLIVGAGLAVLLTANPFTHGLLDTGVSLGLDPYLLIQSVVPVATEAPELVVVAVLVANRRPAQGLALLLASSVSQWTLGLGSLPIAYAAGGGGLYLPLAPREQLELGLTTAVSLFVVAALATLRPARVDAVLVVVVFALQLIYPDPFIRFVATLILLVVAIDLFASRWRHLQPVLRSIGPSSRRVRDAR
jgi:cation:H+ antiporter